MVVWHLLYEDIIDAQEVGILNQDQWGSYLLCYII